MSFPSITIADVAVRKLFVENSVSNARIYNKRMLYETRASIASVQVYAVRNGLRQVSPRCIAWQGFLENNFADFLDKCG